MYVQCTLVSQTLSETWSWSLRQWYHRTWYRVRVVLVLTALVPSTVVASTEYRQQTSGCEQYWALNSERTERWVVSREPVSRDLRVATADSLSISLLSVLCGLWSQSVVTGQSLGCCETVTFEPCARVSSSVTTAVTVSLCTTFCSLGCLLAALQIVVNFNYRWPQLQVQKMVTSKLLSFINQSSSCGSDSLSADCWVLTEYWLHCCCDLLLRLQPLIHRYYYNMSDLLRYLFFGTGTE